MLLRSRLPCDGLSGDGGQQQGEQAHVALVEQLGHQLLEVLRRQQPNSGERRQLTGKQQWQEDHADRRWGRVTEAPRRARPGESYVADEGAVARLACGT